MTLRRNSENFQAIRAKFEGSKEMVLTAKAESVQKMGSSDTDGKTKSDYRSDSPVKNQSSSRRIQRLSSIASLSTMSVFSNNPFQRRKNTDVAEASGQSGDNENLSSQVAASSKFNTTRISSDLNRPTIGCASFGMSLGMSPKSTKKPKSIPRFNTTGNLLLQPSTPATSPASTFKAPSTAKKRLPSSQSSNALPVLQRSRIPTPIRAQESSIATYTYSWAKTTPIKTETGTKHVHRYEPALSGIGIPSEPSKSPAKISLVPKSQTQNDVVLPVKKAFQVQCQPVMNKDGAETSSIGQASWSSRKRTAGPSQIIDPEHEASASASVPVFSRPSLPLKAQSSQNLLGQRPCRETVTRAFSGGITHFSSVITVDPKHVEYARGISRGVTLKNLGNSSSQNEMAEMQRKINEVSDAKPAPYWCGRLVAMQDRLRSEKYLSTINMPSATSHLSLGGDSVENSQVDDGLENTFTQLQSCCTTTTARESFATFQKQHSRYRNPALARRRFHGASRYDSSSSSNITLDALSAELAGPSLLTRLKMKKGHL